MPRAFAFTSTAMLLGVVIYMFTQNIAHFINEPGVTGVVFSLGFLLFYLNINYFLSKRFARKTIYLVNFPYIIAALIILPAAILSSMTGQFAMITQQVIYVVIILMGSLLGASLGIKKGLKIRKAYFEKTANDQPDIPEDLRRASEKFSNN
ncbi:MAG: hypothetical protein WED82_14055 [Balneolales bacterium]